MSKKHRRLGARRAGVAAATFALVASGAIVGAGTASAAEVPTGTVQISSMTWSGESNGYGPIERNQSNGEAGRGDGLPLTLGGIVYPTGVGMHATGALSTALGGNCSTFSAVVGVDDSKKSHPTEPGIGSVRFEVYGDGALLQQTAVITGNDAPVTLTADVTGVETLRLVAHEATNGKNYDHADWGDAKVECRDTLPGIPEIIETWQIHGPDGSDLVGEVRIDENGEVGLGVTADGAPAIDARRLGLTGSDGDFRSGLTFVERTDSVVNESYTMTTGKQHERTATFAESIFTFADEAGTEIGLNVRLSDDGVAYRYEIEGEGTHRVDDESGEWVLPADGAAWMQKSYDYNYEADWTTTTASAANDRGTVPYPALFEQGERFVLLTESNLHGNYSASHLTHATGSLRYGVDLFQGAPVSSDGDLATPWRVAIVGELDAVVESTLVDDLASPSQLADTSWVKTGISSWSWLTDWGSPRNEARQRDFVDLSARNGWEYVLLDEGWDASWVPRTVRYAHTKGVDTIIWFHSRDLRTQEQRDRWLPMIKSWGVSGIKVDFMDTDSQEIHQWYDAISADTAKYELMINFHGSSLPTGMQRTWPHIMSYESVRGAENGISPSRSLTAPFVRGVVGSMDWTPGVFSKGNSNSSKAQEVAMSIVYESGWTHYADKPETYAAEPNAQTFMQNVPASWEATKLIDGRPAESIVLARQSEDDWLVGGMRAGSGAPLQLPLADLGYTGDVIVDLLADNGGNGSSTTLTSTRHAADAVLQVPTATNGGFAARVCSAQGRTSCLTPVTQVPAVTVAVTPQTADVEAGETITVSATLTLPSTAATGVTFAPTAPEGWTVTGAPVTAASLAAGTPLTGSWQVTAPAEGVSGAVEIPVEATYTAAGGERWAASQATLWVLPSLGYGDHYISDLEWLAESNGYGPVERDQSNGQAARDDGRPIEIADVTYDKGVGMHATGAVTVWLGERCTTFSSIVGIDDEVLETAGEIGTGSVRFEVWGDDVLLKQTAVITNADGGVPLDVDVTGVSRLRLVADEATNGKNFDHADWALAKVSCEAPPVADGVVVVTSPEVPDGENDWFRSAVEVTLSATPAGTEAELEQSTDGTTWTAYTGPFTISADGVTQVGARLADGSGEVAVREIRIDATSPTTVIDGVGADGAPTGEITWTAQAPSGIASYEVTLDGAIVEIDSIAVGDVRPGVHTLSVTATSTAGTTGAATVIELRVPSPFVDVPLGTRFFDDITWLVEQGISTGWETPEGTQFRPLAPIARDAMAAFLYRASGSPEFTAPATSPFTDVAPSNQFYKEITWLAAEGISTGWVDGAGAATFRPLEPIARDAMAAFLFRLADVEGYTPPSVPEFKDVAVSSTYYTEISWLAESGIATGWQGNDGSARYLPLESVNRDAMAAFLHRFHSRD